MLRKLATRLLRSCAAAPLLITATAAAHDFNVDAKLARDADRFTVTIFVDADLFSREDGAAAELTKAHTAFAALGYRLHSIVPHVENADLEGFFVTYQRGQVQKD